MYQGKFDKKRKSSSASTSELVSERNAAAERAAQKAARTAPAQKQASRAAAPQKQTASRQPVPQKQAAPQKQTAARQAPAQRQAAPQKQTVPQSAPPRRGPRLGGVIFYTLYFLFIFLFFVATFIGLKWVQGFLIDYEAAQPTVKCEEVFHQLFDDPDWGALYDAAGVEDTEYEGKEEFVAYMENLVGDSELTYQETSAGLSGNKKYFVKLGDAKLASFTLVDENASADAVPSMTEIADWKLGDIELFYEREESYRIQLVEGHTAYVNGVPLGEEFTIQKTTSRSGGSDFLPAGVSSSSCIHIQEIDGLMGMPTVKILDANGTEMEMVYDSEQEMFVEQTETTTISDEEKEIVLKAMKTYAEYQIKEATSMELAKYFDSNEEAYKSIMQTVLAWTKGNNGYSFSEESVTHYARYSDTMFSVYASTKMSINLTDGGTTEKPINATFLFSKKSGSWKIIKMTNADIAELVTQVRLTFKDDDNVLSNDFYDNDTTLLNAPLVSVPDGKVFSGWVRHVVDENGKDAWELVFTPEEDGVVTIPSGTILEPMTLYALFEDAPTTN